jgi:hypothetical protein
MLASCHRGRAGCGQLSLPVPWLGSASQATPDTGRWLRSASHPWKPCLDRRGLSSRWPPPGDRRVGGPTAVAAAIGPPVGGYLTDGVSWRAVFLVNLPLAAFVIIAAILRVPETRDPTRPGGLDLRGAALPIAGACFAVIQGN